MNITLNNSEIEEGVAAFINSQGIDLSNKSIDINFTVGRGGNGVTASVEIMANPETQTPPAPVTSEPTSKAADVISALESSEDTPAAAIDGESSIFATG